MNYNQKYLKYKSKYLKLKSINQIGGDEVLAIEKNADNKYQIKTEDDFGDAEFFDIEQLNEDIPEDDNENLICCINNYSVDKKSLISKATEFCKDRHIDDEIEKSCKILDKYIIESQKPEFLSTDRWLKLSNVYINLLNI